MNKTILAVLVGVLAGGGAIAAYQNYATPYAEVVSATPITEKEAVYADVVAVEPVTETRNVSRQVCEDVAVERRRPERFGNRDGAVIGAVVGGLVGNQVGDGNGRRLATVAGAVGGGYAGRNIDRNHQGGQRYTAYEKQCRSVSEPREEVIGYDVQYRRDGDLATTRVEDKPGAQIQVGERDRIVAYDVTWRYDGQTGSLEMADDPGDRLPVKDGVIVVAGAEPVRMDPARDTPPRG